MKHVCKTITTIPKCGNNAMRSTLYYKSLACDELSDIFY